MTDEPKQKPKKPAPAKGKKTKVKKPKVKRVRQVGVFSILFLIIFLIAIVTFTPVYSIALRLIPEQYKHVIFHDIHQTIVLDKNKKMSEPLKYVPTDTLPVLGYNSGVCFSFPDASQPGNNNSMNKIALKKAAKGEKIAEIIVIGNNKYEYSIETTTLENTTNEEGEDISNICQIFGKDYPIIPRIINKVFIRPLAPFAPQEVLWTTTRNIYTY